MRLEIATPQKWPIAEKAIAAIEHMLSAARVEATPDGGLIWMIELDGYAYSMTVDRDGKVRSTMSD